MPVRTGGLERARDFPTADVNDALRHLLKLLLRVGNLSGANPKLGEEVMRLRRDVGCATLPEDYEEVCDHIRALELGAGLSGLDGDDDTSLLRDVIEAALPVARALRGEGPVMGLLRLQKEMAQAGEDERKQLHRNFEKIADSVSWLRQMCDVFKLSALEVVGALGQLSGDEAGAGRRLGKISEAIEIAGEINELHGLREALLHEARGLVQEAGEREQRLCDVRDQVVRARKQCTALEEALEDANQMAQTDPLTGLGNRRALEAAVLRLAKTDCTAGIVALDIDHFKQVNDTHGHEAGDLVIRRVAEVLRGEMRGGDTAYRVGGEEFLVLLSGTDTEQARTVAERMRLQFQQRAVPYGDGELSSTISLGVAPWRSDQKFSEAAASADAALYSAKRGGRNRVV